MSQDELNERLSAISTMWTELKLAHEGETDAARAAHEALVQRYGQAVHRYLLAGLRDADAADDLFQEFALRLVNGSFRAVDPQRGRFRSYVKTVLFHMVQAYRKRRPFAAPLESEPVAPTVNLDHEFTVAWREALMTRAWRGLAETHPTFYEVLRFRAAHPEMPSPEMAEQLSCILGKTMSAAAVRQTLHRARDKFAHLLIDEVAHSLDPLTREVLEDELITLDLMSYCRQALKTPPKYER